MELLLRGCFGRKLAPSEKVADDLVYPLHTLDNTRGMRTLVMGWTVKFNDVLDPEMLHASLSRLLEIGDWKKLGGRLRLNEAEKLELHVPRIFTTQRPAVAYTHQVHNISIDDHPIAKKYPKPTPHASIREAPRTFRSLVAPENHPSSLEEYLYHDVPILSLQITSFTDGTIIGLAFHHCLMDVMGQKAIMEAWSLVVAGREAEVKPLLGAKEDVLDVALRDSTAPKEPFGWEKMMLGGFRWVRFLFRFATDRRKYGTVVPQGIFLPKQAMEQLRREAKEDALRAQQDDGHVDEKPAYISDNDIITAWISRMILKSMPRKRSLIVWHISNMRFRIPILKKSAGVYIQNLVLGAFFIVSPDMANKSLGQVALENRRALAPQMTEAQTLAMLRFMQPKGFETASAVAAETNSIPLTITNWTRADLFRACDFSAAVVRAGEMGPSRTNPPGTMVFHCVQMLHKKVLSLNAVTIGGEDLDGGYWMDVAVFPRVWETIRREVERLA